MRADPFPPLWAPLTFLIAGAVLVGTGVAFGFQPAIGFGTGFGIAGLLLLCFALAVRRLRGAG